MSKGHNKKRNVGLIYEQVINKASAAMMDGGPEHAKMHISFLKKHFSEGSELLKEFKLFNAILDTSGVSEKVADRVLELARESIKSIDFKKLDFEKGAFINEANRTFGKGKLFETRVENFRALATVQSLLNEWRSPGMLSPAMTAQYENQLREYMMLNAASPATELSEGVDEISVKMFHKRFNETYGEKFTSSQKDFLHDFMFMDHEHVIGLITATRQKALSLLSERNNVEDNSMLKRQYSSVYENVLKLDPADPQSPARQLTLLQLIEELEDENE